jgi:hypothetical protein
MEKQEFTDLQIGVVKVKKVICKTMQPNTKVSACRKCCFDHEKQSDYCDHVACVDYERKDNRDVYFENVK